MFKLKKIKDTDAEVIRDFRNKVPKDTYPDPAAFFDFIENSNDDFLEKITADDRLPHYRDPLINKTLQRFEAELETTYLKRVEEWTDIKNGAAAQKAKLVLRLNAIERLQSEHKDLFE